MRELVMNVVAVAALQIVQRGQGTLLKLVPLMFFQCGTVCDDPRFHACCHEENLLIGRSGAHSRSFAFLRVPSRSFAFLRVPSRSFASFAVRKSSLPLSRRRARRSRPTFFNKKPFLLFLGALRALAVEKSSLPLQSTILNLFHRPPTLFLILFHPNLLFPSCSFASFAVKILFSSSFKTARPAVAPYLLQQKTIPFLPWRPPRLGVSKSPLQSPIPDLRSSISSSSSLPLFFTND
jgi:hypothetical protein